MDNDGDSENEYGYQDFYNHAVLFSHLISVRNPFIRLLLRRENLLQRRIGNRFVCFHCTGDHVVNLEETDLLREEQCNGAFICRIEALPSEGRGKYPYPVFQT